MKWKIQIRLLTYKVGYIYYTKYALDNSTLAFFKAHILNENQSYN